MHNLTSYGTWFNVPHNPWGIYVPSYGRAERLQKKTTYGILGGPRVSGLPFPGSSLQPTGRITSSIPNWDPEEVWGCKVGYVILITSYSHLITILNGLYNRYKPTNMTGLPKKLWDSTLPPIDSNRSAN